MANRFTCSLLLSYFPCVTLWWIFCTLHGCSDSTASRYTSPFFSTSTESPTPQPTPQPTSDFPNDRTFEGAAYVVDQFDYDMGMLQTLTGKNFWFNQLLLSPTGWTGQVYDLGDSVNSNHLGVFSCKAGYDHCADTCVMTWEGSKSLNDWIHDFNILSEDWCGLENIHKGLVWEMHERLVHSEFQKAKTRLMYLQKQKECSTVYMVGHSLGGALAELFAHCAKKGNDLIEEVKGTIDDGTTVKILTFAALALQGNGAPRDAWLAGIPGKRFFSTGDSGYVDMVPAITQTFNFHHPLNLTVIELNVETPSQSLMSDAEIYQLNAPNNCCREGWGWPSCSVATCVIRTSALLHRMDTQYKVGLKKACQHGLLCTVV